MLDIFYRNILFSLNIYLAFFKVVDSSITSVELTDSNPIVYNSDVIDEFIDKEVQKGFPGAALIVNRYDKIVKQNIYGYKLKYDENGTVIKI